MAETTREARFTRDPAAGAEPARRADGAGFERRIGLRSATAINMTQMCGIGPFVTIPLMVAALGGPQAVFGWIFGALLALADGLVWAELGAAMPGAGGTYLYLREGFQYRTGRLMPFLFVWTAMLTIPLIMSTGVIGIVQYLGFLAPGMTSLETHVISLAIVALVLFALYRRIESIGAITTVLWSVAFLCVGMVIVASLTHFHPDLAFTYPKDAFAFGGPFWAGLGAGLLISIYDYLGYNTSAYLGAEVRDPGRVLPRSIVVSVIGIMVVYLAHADRRPRRRAVAGGLEVGLGRVARARPDVGQGGGRRRHGPRLHHGVRLGVRRAAGRLARAVQRRGGRALLPPVRPAAPAPPLPARRAARDGPHHRDRQLLHAEHGDLRAARGVRDHPGDRAGPRAHGPAPPAARAPAALPQWLYPVPSLRRARGLDVRVRSAGRTPIIFSIVVLAAGIAAFLVWARIEREWPFGPRHVREAFLEEQADRAPRRAVA